MNLCGFVPVQSSQTRAWGREFVHVCFGLLRRLMQVGANMDAPSKGGPRRGSGYQGAHKGTNVRGRTEPNADFRRFLQILGLS